MKTDEMLLKYVNREKGHQRQIGRYWASNLNDIIKGYLKPEDYFKKKKIDQQGCENITMGEAMEELWLKIFQANNADCRYQDQKELEIDKDIILVVKPDFNFKSLIIEMKCPDKPMANIIPAKWQFQLEAEAQAFKKPVYLGIIRKHPLLTLILYKPNDIIWEVIQDELRNFHSKLCQLNKKTT